MGAQSWVVGLGIYFLGIGLLTLLGNLAGIFDDDAVVLAGGANYQQLGAINTTVTAGDVGLFGGFKFSTFLKDIFSLFVFNISVSGDSLFVQYLWLIRILFIWLPGVMFVLGIYYSLPTVAGGG